MFPTWLLCWRQRNKGRSGLLDTCPTPQDWSATCGNRETQKYFEKKLARGIKQAYRMEQLRSGGTRINTTIVFFRFESRRSMKGG